MKKVLLLLMTVIILGGCQNTTPHADKYDNSQKEDYTAKDNQTMEVILTVNDQDFVISLEQNDTAEALVEQLPMEITMEDLNGNEKYYYTQNIFPTDAQSVGKIEAGDFMLFGNNCLVLFYESFTTSYSYTRLGKIKNVKNFLNVISQNNDVNGRLHQ